MGWSHPGVTLWSICNLVTTWWSCSYCPLKRSFTHLQPLPAIPPETSLSRVLLCWHQHCQKAQLAKESVLVMWLAFCLLQLRSLLSTSESLLVHSDRWPQTLSLCSASQWCSRLALGLLHWPCSLAVIISITAIFLALYLLFPSQPPELLKYFVALCSNSTWKFQAALQTIPPILWKQLSFNGRFYLNCFKFGLECFFFSSLVKHSSLSFMQVFSFQRPEMWSTNSAFFSQSINNIICLG